MSKFYGTVSGNANTNATRRGFEDIKVCAQSWDGSVITRLYYNRDNELMVNVETSEVSSTYGTTIFNGSFEDFKKKLLG